MSTKSHVILRWFPPSWIELRHAKYRVHIDTAYLKTYYAQHPTRIEYSSWPDKIDGLPEVMDPADVILLTHAHKDHCKRVTVRRLTKATTRIVCPASCRKELGENVSVVEAGDVIDLPGLRIQAVPAHNTPGGRSTRKQHPEGRDVGYLITIGGVTIYHAGDTDVLPEMGALGHVDVACLPIGGTFTMDAEEAVQATLDIDPVWVVPMHWLKADPREFVQALRKSGSSARPALLAIGEELPVTPLAG